MPALVDAMDWALSGENQKPETRNQKAVRFI
jgi:hypothetical protein